MPVSSMKGPETIPLPLSGMSCAHCVRAVREALEGVEGVAVQDVAVGEACVTVDVPGTWETLEPKVRAALDEAGYPLAA